MVKSGFVAGCRRLTGIFGGRRIGGGPDFPLPFEAPEDLRGEAAARAAIISNVYDFATIED